MWDGGRDGGGGGGSIDASAFATVSDPVDIDHMHAGKKHHELRMLLQTQADTTATLLATSQGYAELERAKLDGPLVEETTTRSNTETTTTPTTTL